MSEERPDTRAERLKAALRANLRRRRVQVRARAAQPSGGVDARSDEGEAAHGADPPGGSRDPGA